MVIRNFFPVIIILFSILFSTVFVLAADSKVPVDFNRDIRSILSNACFKCHGPDENERQGGLRLDSPEGMTAKLESESIAIVPEKPELSALLQRITTDDADLQMPPAESGKKLSPKQIALIKRWIEEGAPLSKHWSYIQPVRPVAPREKVSEALKAAGKNAEQTLAWPKNDIDYFVLNRLVSAGLRPQPEASKHALIRRVSLDLTGLPPTLAEVEQFVKDADPKAYEKLVDRLLKRSSYGEHWARKWLDLARYADSAGYADDPSRTIWAYRNWVIRSLNANKPFDQFTIEQIAGDLLPNPTEDQLIATAFHRNTLTNSEGGTDDEEFRNVAIVDRVNTTMAVWMGTTINCCQCHSHKYDPITQTEYFQMFAILNNTSDADRRDESPLHEIWTKEQTDQKADWKEEIAALKKTVTTSTAELTTAQTKWEERFSGELTWKTTKPATVKLQSGGSATIAEDGAVLVAQPQKTDIYTLDLPVESTAGKELKITAIRLEALPHEKLPSLGPGHAGGNFVVTRMLASVIPPTGSKLSGRYIRIENTGKAKILSLAEVQVFDGSENIAISGAAKQSSIGSNGPAELGIDGNTDGNYLKKSVTHTATEDNPWWELDLKSAKPIDRIAIWNRTDNGLHTRLKDFKITVLDEARKTVWETTVAKSPNPNGEYSLSGVRGVTFAAAYADFSQSGFAATNVLDGKNPNNTGWAIAPQVAKPHALTLIPAAPVKISVGSKLNVKIEQLSAHENHTLGHFRISMTDDPRVTEYAKTPAAVLVILKTNQVKRTAAQRLELTKYYLTIAPELKKQRDQLAKVEKQLAAAKPSTTVPIMQELPKDKQRKSHLQHRGNFLSKGEEVTAGLPAAFHPLPEGVAADRMALARWLVDEQNPLTARVIANRYWESIFGRGIVKSSEEFGSQGDLPTHPELLDWLATELTRLNWDTQAFLKTLVTSATYRQSSRVTPELYDKDPENILLARGPRFRLSAEMIRDQALSVSGLLGSKMYGMPVKPPQPKLGLSAAFGSKTDWETSKGEDRYRRGIYTTWRRSNPYPSMAAFDAPNREVCTIRRDRTNTPLQALVTLNDPVYIEAAQALARRIAAGTATTAEKAKLGFQICLSRQPTAAELEQLTKLYEKAHAQFAKTPDDALQLATKPLGPLPEGSNAIDLAAWTVVGNVLLNLDEMLMKR